MQWRQCPCLHRLAPCHRWLLQVARLRRHLKPRKAQRWLRRDVHQSWDGYQLLVLTHVKFCIQLYQPVPVFALTTLCPPRRRLRRPDWRRHQGQPPHNSESITGDGVRTKKEEEKTISGAKNSASPAKFSCVTSPRAGGGGFHRRASGWLYLWRLSSRGL